MKRTLANMNKKAVVALIVLGLSIGAAAVIVPLQDSRSATEADSLPLTLVSQTSNTITLGWTPQTGFGYLFFTKASSTAAWVLVSRTNSATASSVKFNKGSYDYKVSVITEGNNGHCQFTAANGCNTPPPPPPPPAGTITQTITAGSTLSGVVTWHGVYDANADGVEDDPGSVRFSVDGTAVLTEIDPPFGDTTGFWGSTTVANGSHTFKVEALNSSGTVLVSNTVTATVSNGTPPPPPAQCADSLDNDGDGKIDYPADPGCSSATDTDETDPAPPAGNVFVSPTGNDANPCTQASPCRSWQRGITVAASGDTITVLGGTYPAQVLTGTKAVTFRVAQGQTAVLSGGGPHDESLNIDRAGNISVYGAVTLNHTNGGTGLWVECSTNILLDGLNGDGGDYFLYNGDDGITIQNSRFGGYSPSVGYGDPAISGWNGSGSSNCALSGGDGIVRNVTIRNSYFHDVYYTGSGNWGGAHPDCMEGYGGMVNITIENNVFERCGNTFMLMLPTFGNITNLTVQNNVMRGVYESFWSVQLGTQNGGTCSNLVFRYNTIDTVDGGANAPPRLFCTTQSVYGNIVLGGGGPSEGDGCKSASWSYNVFQSGACGSNSTTGTVAFVKKPVSATDTADYHLASGSIAVGAGDPARFPPTDFEGTVRSSPPDAGYDER